MFHYRDVQSVSKYSNCETIICKNIFNDLLIENVDILLANILSLLVQNMNDWGFLRNKIEHYVPMFLRYDLPDDIKPLYTDLIAVSNGDKNMNEIDKEQLLNILNNFI